MLNKILNLAIPQALAANGEVDIGTEVDGYFGYTCVGEFISNIVSVGIIIASLATLVFLVWGGIEWITSGGDKAKVEVAQKRLTSAVIGLAIVVVSWALWKIILYFFGIEGDICNPLGAPGGGGGGGGIPPLPQ